LDLVEATGEDVGEMRFSFAGNIFSGAGLAPPLGTCFLFGLSLVVDVLGKKK